MTKTLFFFSFIWKLKCLYLFGHHTFPIPGVTPLGEVVYSGKLNESREDKGVANGDEPVHGCGIGHLGQRVSRADTQGGHGKDSGHSCSGQSIRKALGLNNYMSGFNQSARKQNSV